MKSASATGKRKRTALAESPSTSHFTICVLCYGPHLELADRFLGSLYRCTDPKSFTLRAGLNAVVPATAALFEEYSRRFGNIEIFRSEDNLFKSPMMRRMFYEQPLETEWVIWFDDDSYVERADWLQRLAVKIQCEPDVAQWGKQFVLWRQDAEIGTFIENAPWYRGLPVPRQTDPNGVESYEFHFATGGFWAIKTEVIRALDWPEPRIRQAGEDYILGEALRQNGYRKGSFDRGLQVNAGDTRNVSAAESIDLPGCGRRKAQSGT